MELASLINVIYWLRLGYRGIAQFSSLPHNKSRLHERKKKDKGHEKIDTLFMALHIYLKIIVYCFMASTIPENMP
jgi:hypothetical protein